MFTSSADRGALAIKRAHVAVFIDKTPLCLLGGSLGSNAEHIKFLLPRQDRGNSLWGFSRPVGRPRAYVGAAAQRPALLVVNMHAGQVDALHVRHMRVIVDDDGPSDEQNRYRETADKA